MSRNLIFVLILFQQNKDSWLEMQRKYLLIQKLPLQYNSEGNASLSIGIGMLQH
jgi:hypothetical protein